MLYTVDDNRKFPFSTVGIFSIFVAVWMGKMSNIFANQLTISNKGLAM